MRSALVVAGAALALSLACSGKTLPYAGGLMIAVQTDLAAPKDVAAVGLYITSDGRPIFGDTREVAPTGEVKFPATIAVVADAARPRAVVKIRAVAFKTNGDVRVLRDIVTTIPKGRTGLLRAPLLWINEGSGSGNRGQLLQSASLRPLDGTSDGFSRLQSACPDGQTFLEGACGDATVDGDALPDYVEADVFGGGNAQGEGGRCFDVLACFDAPVQVALDEATCTGKVDGVDPNDPNLSLAIVLPASADAGECKGDKCFVPLDKGAGWTVAGAGIQLPKALCTRIAEGKAKGVAASRACPTKDATTPSCGPASSVGSGGTPGQLPDAGGRSDGGPSLESADFEAPASFGSEPFLSAVAVTPNEVFLARSSANPPPSGVVKVDRAQLLSGANAPTTSVLVGYYGEAGPSDAPQASSLALTPDGLHFATRGVNGAVHIGGAASGSFSTPPVIEGPMAALGIGPGDAFAAGVYNTQAALWRLPLDGGTPTPAGGAPAGGIESIATGSDALYLGMLDGGIVRCKLPCQSPSDASDLRVGDDSAATPISALALSSSKLFFVRVGANGGGIYEISLDGSAERKLADASEVLVAAAADSPPGLAADGEYVYWSGAFDDPRDGVRKAGVLRRSHVSNGQAEPFLEQGQGQDAVSAIAVDGTHVFWTYQRPGQALLVAKKKRAF